MNMHFLKKSTLYLFTLLIFAALLPVPNTASAAVTVIIDDADVVNSQGVRGFWMERPNRWDVRNDGGAYAGRHHRSDEDDPRDVRWYPVLGAGNAGTYKVYAWWVEKNNNEHVTYRIQTGAGAASVVNINQKNPGDRWVLLGQYAFNGTTNEYVQMNGDKRCSADAIMFEPVITNNAPVAVDDSFTVDEDTSGNILDVMANDYDNDAGDSFSIDSVNSTGTLGTIVNNGTDVSYTPPANYVGTDTFTYILIDSSGSTSAPATVTITVNNINDAPIANPDTYAVEVTSTNILTVMANDTDPDKPVPGDTLTIISIDTTGTVGTVIINAGSKDITYISGGTLGLDKFTYTIKDSAGLTSTTTVSITVSPKNSPPIAVDDNLVVDEDTTANILDVMANDYDVDVGDSFIIFSLDITGTLGTVVNNGTDVSYTPPANYVGTDTFTYILIDKFTHQSTPATVTITVNNVNDAPIATGGESILVVEGTSISILTNGEVSVLANDTDIDGDTLTAVLVSSVTAPGASLVLNADGTFIYYAGTTPPATDSFSYQAFDGTATSTTVTVTITIVPSNHELSGKTEKDFTSLPLNLTTAATPLVMLAASNDHQLFFKAYDDYSDIDGDGINDTTYKSSIDYYGYFDSYKCYNYNTTTDRFEPKAASDENHYCTTAGAEWSGNFMNWVSMSRIDSIRKILFGGHRRVDTSSETVLERSYLPHDAHSWAKFYNGNDYDKMTPFTLTADGITFCNTTDVNGSYVSTADQVVFAPPLIKVVAGDYSLWAGNERWQCTWRSGAPYDNHAASNGNVPANSGSNAKSNNPVYGDGLGEKQYNARVQVCVDGLIGQERCKKYPSGNYKPIGLLQVYGDEDQIHFGMVAGTYNKHVSGGSIIRNIGSMTDEVNVDTDGTFPLVADTAGGPADSNSNKSEGLINAWSLYRIVGYNHGDGTYNSGDNCSWGLSDFADVSGANECRNWGNPFSEIYFQALRYFSNAGVTGVYQSSSKSGIRGLPVPMGFPNPNPLSDDNSCANLNIIALNSSIASYDGDELDANSCGVQEIWDTSVLPSGGTSAHMTNVVGDLDGIRGNNFFIGESLADSNQLCTGKLIGGLGWTQGICPEAPRLAGTYKIAGLAYYAQIEDIRADYLTGGRALDGMQKIDTYAVESSASSPKINIPHPITLTTAAIIMPACRNTTLNPGGNKIGNCALVDFKIIDQVIDDGSGNGSGKFYVNWEDSEQGGDYDQDMWGTIEYTIDGHTNTLKVTTDVHAQSTNFKMGFGYIVSGTTKDGFHVHSGINSFSYADSVTVTSGKNCSTSCVSGDASSTVTYSLGNSTAELLEPPLWYAAKWGGFQDSNGNKIPDLQTEWDAKDADGNPNSDGVPDNYFFAHNPKQLEKSLNTVFLAILNRSSSGTAAAVVSNNVRGEGALYQAFYEPQKQDSNGNVASWIGTIHALWIDTYGNMREDNGDAKLGNFDDDPVIATYYDETLKRTRVKRWNSSDPDTFIPDNYITVELKDLHPLWNARKQLYLSTLTDNDLISQRVYDDSAANGRYIMTWYDNDRDGSVDSNEYTDFVSSNITSANFAYYDIKEELEVKKMIDYIRGVEKTDYRNRSVDYDGDGTTEVVRLGDIINSTPTVVGAPAEGLNLLYRDSSFATFRDYYGNRREVLYAGANDGMLHAFNAGFFKPDTMEFSTIGNKADGTGQATAHPLGSELWAYVPMNLQPHLQWLKSPAYGHVYFMDLKPKVFDAKIFDAGYDAAGIYHPEGWGTILIAGMRFGGGAMKIDTAGNGFLPAPLDTDDKIRSSAYIILDITDPELPPNLLGEIQTPHPSFATANPVASFTTAYPAGMYFKTKRSWVCSDTNRGFASSAACTKECTTGTCDNNDPNKWFLIFGSGPDDLSTGNSSTTAKLYILDFEELTSPGSTTAIPPGCSLATVPAGSPQMLSCDTGAANQFIGTPVTIDDDFDYLTEAIYFGTVGNVINETSSDGRMYRMFLKGDEDPNNWNPPEMLLDTKQPVYAAPNVGFDHSSYIRANKWVFFGTGRLFSNKDKTNTAVQSLYAVKERKSYECLDSGKMYYKPTDCTKYCSSGNCQDNGFTSFTQADLLDITNLEVLTNGDIMWVPPIGSPLIALHNQDALDKLGVVTAIQTNETYYDVVERDIKEKRAGWKMDLPPIYGDLSAPATRMLNQQALLGGILFSSVYQPSLEICATEGFSRLYGQHYLTGTGLPDTQVFGTANYNGYKYSTRYVNLGFGMPTSPSIHTGAGTGNDGLSVFVQLSTGAIIRTPAKTKYSIRSGRQSWRQR